MLGALGAAMLHFNEFHFPCHTEITESGFEGIQSQILAVCDREQPTFSQLFSCQIRHYVLQSQFGIK